MLQRSVAGKYTELCTALCQDIWVCSEIGLVLQQIGVGLQMKKDCTDVTSKIFSEVSDCPRITLDFLQSEKQKPDCAQQPTHFLRGYDISHGHCPHYQHTNFPASFPHSPLTCRQAASGTADPVPPSFPTATEQHNYKTHFQESDPMVTMDTHSTSWNKRHQQIDICAPAHKAALTSASYKHSAATLRLCTL